MELISPKVYIESKINYSINELEKERQSLITKIEAIKTSIKDNVFDVINGSKESKLQIYENYLKELDDLIESKKCL